MRYSRDFTITKQDTQKFYQMLVLRRWSKGSLAFALVGALVARLYLDWLNLSLGTAGSLAAMIAFGILTAALILLGMLLRTRSKVSAALRRSGRESYVQQTRIDGFGVHVTVEKNTAKVGFEKLLRVQETADAFYLFLTESEAWILPKSRMEDAAAETRTLREIFSKVIAPKRLNLQK